jgi:hypothetical protein
MRWAKAPAALITPMETIEFLANGEAMPPSPFAKHKGELSLGGHPVDVYVLDTGDRVISLGAVVKAISGVDARASMKPPTCTRMACCGIPTARRLIGCLRCGGRR